MRALIALLPGDGIGPEVVAAGAHVLREVAARSGHQLELREALIGGAAIDQTGSPLPPETLELCLRADAVLLGAVGGPKWDGGSVRPEQGLLSLRKHLALYANVRPVAPHPRLLDASPLKPSVLHDVNLVIVRELTSGIYFGEKRRGADSAFDGCSYTSSEVRRVVRVAARIAQARRRRLTSVDKANVLATSGLWREVTSKVVAEEFPEVQLEHALVDSFAMQLIQRPGRFDVVVTENLFGDVLSDEAAVLAGSIGLLPSASLGDGARGLYEPIHGSAPDIAGLGVANPFGTIASVALLLRHSLGLEEAARSVERAVSAAIDAGALTADLAPKGRRAATTREATDAVLRALAEERT